jgi:hypothetical protein
MLKHDPFAPLVRAEMADRWERAARARLRRSVRQGRTTTGLYPAPTPGPFGLLWRFVCRLRVSTPTTRTSLDSPAGAHDPRVPRVAPPFGG